MPVDSLPLRDIHLPSSVSWWPPAIGWWLLMVMVILMTLIAVWLVRRYQVRRLYRSALQRLNQIQHQYKDNKNDQQLVRSLSTWLRRICISRYPAVDVAGLTGAEWLQFLDRHLSATSTSTAFSQGVGAIILTAPYQNNSTINGPELLSLCQLWLKKLPHRSMGAS